MRTLTQLIQQPQQENQLLHQNNIYSGDILRWPQLRLLVLPVCVGSKVVALVSG